MERKQIEASSPDSMILLHDATSQQWLQFRNAQEIVEIHQVDEVLPALCRVEGLVNQHGWYAAGFLSYEAAPAFDPSFRTHPPGDFPLLWLGLYPAPRPIKTLPSPPAAYSLGEWIPSVNQSGYGKAIAQIKAHIARGETYQVNYTIRLDSSFKGDAWSLFLTLARGQQSDYAAFVDTGRFVICSASPELFFRLDGNHILARPMKGTAPRGLTLTQDKDQAEWLGNSEKNRAENVMIVDMIRNDLGRIAETGSVHVASLFDIERYPTLWQMTSTVTARTKASIAGILAALFPCASITGAPKIRTMSIIANLEHTPRKIYTGCIGFMAPRRSAQFNVAIRTVLIDRLVGRAEYGVGGGIVWDSSSQDEYAECQTKARLLTYAPPDFSLLESILWTPEEGYFLLPYHIRRLNDSASYFGFPLDTALVREKLDELTSSLPPTPHKVILLAGRGGEINCQSTPLSAISKPPCARLRLSPEPVHSRNTFLFHKTTHRQVYETARAACPDCDDVLLWNERGEITESDSANIVVEMDGQMYTPPLTSGLLPGTFRSYLLEQGTIHERVIKINDLQKCDKIHLINSIRKWREAILL